MSKKSASEVQSIILDIFKEHGDFYSMKEVESMAKAKGVANKTTRDMIQTLVGSQNVETAKIGPINYYWIPYKLDTSGKKAKVDELKKLNKSLEEKIKNLKEESEKSQGKAAPESPEDALKREQFINDIKLMTAKEMEAKSELKELQTSSELAEIAKLEKSCDELKDAVNRWTDNIFNAIEYTKKKLNLEDTKKIYKECNIPEDLDYIE